MNNIFDMDDDFNVEDYVHVYKKWSTSDGSSFFPTSETKGKLPPGVYDIRRDESRGLFFYKTNIMLQGLIRFPESNSDVVIDEISKFWDREDVFKKYKIIHKRGILLFGPPGSGKSSTIQFVMKDVVDRGGIVVRFCYPKAFVDSMRFLRQIEPEKPVVVLMEDIDAILRDFNESDVLNILDGVDQFDKVVFLATTNYPERLGGRIINRPSRFDKRFKIGYPNAESRRMYIDFITGGKKEQKKYKINVQKWVDDTEGFSVAHLKELFTAVVILGDSYDSAIETLRTMSEESVSSDDDSVRPLGFGACEKNQGRSKGSAGVDL